MDSLQRLIILPHEPIATVNPYLHGHFAEHLGEMIYPGLWVGEKSPIPNTAGLRNDVLHHLRRLGVPVLRWPGGNFADTYQWKDGVGPRDQRPLRLNVQWGNAPETNAFGTHEFMALCRALDAEPYFAGNVGSETPAYLREWVEYCNEPGPSALADQRRANGLEQPFNVKYWGIGNEMWGAGGQMAPEHYAAEYCRYRSFLRDYAGLQTFGIASGPCDADYAWTRGFFEYLQKKHWRRTWMVQGFAAHYYCWNTKREHGTATDFTADQYLAMLAKALATEGIIRGNRAIMDEYDPDRRIKLILDEWGAWHDVEPGKPAWGLYQQGAMRDAVMAAVTLDIFNNHADMLYMANIAQLVNVLHALLLVEEDKCILTPTYHVFDLYKAHRGATAVRTISAAEEILGTAAMPPICRKAYLEPRGASLRAVHGSATLHEGLLTVTCANVHPTEPVEVELELVGGKTAEVEVVRLDGGDMRAHNTFAAPERVKPTPAERIPAKGDRVRVKMGPASVARMQAKLG